MRIVILFVAGGIALFIAGIDELRLDNNDGSEPIEVSLAEIEEGLKSQNYLLLQDFYVDWGNSVYTFEQDYEGQIYPDDDSKITLIYAPIYGGDANKGSSKSKTKNYRNSLFAVLKTTQISRYTDIPNGSEFHESMEGMFIEETNPIGNEDWEILQTIFPGTTDSSEIRVFEEGRAPTGFLAFLMLAGGVLLVGVGIFFVLVMRRRR